jgi:prolyl oligopeptidase PreP (S9A serine peptidase family)
MEDNEEFDLDSLLKEINSLEEPPKRVIKSRVTPQVRNRNRNINESNKGCKEVISNNRNTLKENHSLKSELEKTKEAFELVKGELNEVNLLNSKLLYVNRIFKANNLDDSQKLRVVETLDRAESIKDAKLIYETIKDSFKISKDSKKVKKSRQPIKENFGMASKAAGVSRSKMLKTAPKKAIISESDNMVSRFQKLANINIK